jgi:hypothetical protein
MLMPDAICSRMAEIGSSTAINHVFDTRAHRGASSREWWSAVIVASVHGLQHVKGLAAAALADDNRSGRMRVHS